ncbi:MAG: peptidase M17 [Flavobacteriales bacterium]|nr:MAG: peptidase M17 [Flavobacteriales bacterium]
MKYDYQNLKVKSKENENKVPQIFILQTQTEVENHQCTSTLKDKINGLFQKKENGVLLSFGEQLEFFVIVSKTENEDLRKLGAQVYTEIKNQKITSAEVVPTTLDEKKIFYFVEGLLLSSYHFDKYKKEKSDWNITLHIPESVLSSSKVKELNIITLSTSLTKTLVNEPLNFMDALQFSEIAKEMGKVFGFETEVLDKKQIETLRMGGLLGVNKGSETPPTFNILTYAPENAVNEKPIVLVGKGVMFDTGGYSIKVSGHMTGMKSDMGGGAGVLGAISAIAGNKLPYHIVGLVPATDNKISSNAMVVDDVITTMDGTTVEVLNTDAEGRLILCDALTYAKRYNPELVIDMATLTGASVAITGDFGIAMAGNHQVYMDELKSCGEEVYERLIQLPFWKEYEDLLKSDIADLKNIGGAIGGATTAGKFLEHFTDYPWIHLDIAGIAFIDKNKDYRQSGGTSAPVRLIYDFIKNRTEN